MPSEEADWLALRLSVGVLRDEAELLAVTHTVLVMELRGEGEPLGECEGLVFPLEEGV